MGQTLLMLVVALACVVLGIVIGVISSGRRRRGEVPMTWTARPAGYGSAPDEASIRVGDPVSLEGTPGKVVATIGYIGNGAERWTGACVALSSGQEWVTLVDEERGLEVCRWKKLSFLPGTPGEGKIHYGDHTFAKREAGNAEYDAHGEVDLPSVGEVRYVDYIDGDQRLSFEDYDGAGWEASLGRVLGPGAFVPRR
jgi:hypothetical protein